MIERREQYRPGDFHPVCLGDILDGRYHVFRKLGMGSQATVWLARDQSASARRYVAIKIFKATETTARRRLEQLLRTLPSAENDHVEIGLGSFTLHGPNGTHYCKVLEPLGGPFSSVIEEACHRRPDVDSDEGYYRQSDIGQGPSWSAQSAKQACWQILLGLDYLHSHEIAHRDVRPANVLVALRSNLSMQSENEIQRVVWPSEDGEEHASGSSSDEYSDEEDRERHEEWKRQAMDRRRSMDERWKPFGTGDKLATPHSSEWNTANLVNSREDIEFLTQTDGKPLGLDEIRYIVYGTPLHDAFKAFMEDNEFRLVLGDLDFACAFEDCDRLPLYNSSAYRPPELLIGLPLTHKADIFSAGLLCWEIVMLQQLVWPKWLRNDAGEVYQNNRQIRDYAQRLGPIPPRMRAKWRDADNFVDADGNALSMEEYDGEVYEPGDYEYGDIWHQARLWRPSDMSDGEMEVFVRLVQKMLRWEPQSRLSTSQVLQDEWFQGLADDTTALNALPPKIRPWR